MSKKKIHMIFDEQVSGLYQTMCGRMEWGESAIFDGILVTRNSQDVTCKSCKRVMAKEAVDAEQD